MDLLFDGVKNRFFIVPPIIMASRRSGIRMTAA
jgi:hypothetical protein